MWMASDERTIMEISYKEGLRDARLFDLRCMMETLNLSLSDAMNVLRIPQEEQQTCIDKIAAGESLPSLDEKWELIATILSEREAEWRLYVAKKEAKEEGYREGYRETRLITLKTIVETRSLSLTEAMDALEIPPEERHYYIDMMEAG